MDGQTYVQGQGWYLGLVASLPTCNMQERHNACKLFVYQKQVFLKIVLIENEGCTSLLQGNMHKHTLKSTLFINCLAINSCPWATQMLPALDISHSLLTAIMFFF